MDRRVRGFSLRYGKVHRRQGPSDHGNTGDDFCAPPTMYRFFIKEDLSAYDFSNVKHCTIAGEPLNPEVYYQWLKGTGLKCYEGYGKTELTLAIANFPWMEPKPDPWDLQAPFTMWIW